MSRSDPIRPEIIKAFRSDVRRLVYDNFFWSLEATNLILEKKMTKIFSTRFFMSFPLLFPSHALPINLLLFSNSQRLWGHGIHPRSYSKP